MPTVRTEIKRDEDHAEGAASKARSEQSEEIPSPSIRNAGGCAQQERVQERPRHAEENGLKNGSSAEVGEMIRLHELSTRLLGEASLERLLADALRASMELLGSDMGSVQLYDEQTGALRIVAQAGFGEDFL